MYTHILMYWSNDGATLFIDGKKVLEIRGKTEGERIISYNFSPGRAYAGDIGWVLYYLAMARRWVLEQINWVKWQLTPKDNIEICRDPLDFPEDNSSKFDSIDFTPVTGVDEGTYGVIITDWENATDYDAIEWSKLKTSKMKPSSISVGLALLDKTKTRVLSKRGNNAEDS